jgi:hypothetical protein
MPPSSRRARGQAPRRRIVEEFAPDPARCARALVQLLFYEPPAPPHDPAGTAADRGKDHGARLADQREDHADHSPGSEAPCADREAHSGPGPTRAKRSPSGC